MVWQVSLIINMVLFVAIWFFYLSVRNTDKLIGNGIIAIFGLFSFFWLFGFSMFYFYFLFAPLNFYLRIFALASVSLLLLHRGYLISKDITDTINNKKSLFDKMYVDEGTSFTFTRAAVGYLEKARPVRNSFYSFHGYAAMLVAPFVLILNRILTPITGDGHGVFMITAFFSVPLMMWGMELVVQTIYLMIYFPLEIHRNTGKDVLMKDW